MTMLPKSNRLQKDYNPQVPHTVNHYYDANGAGTLNKPTVSSATTAPVYRWMYYDGLGRMAGYRQGKWTGFPGNLSFDVTGTACRYDADGQMYLPCNTSAPPLSFDGANVIGTSNGWRYIHAPGVDEPLLARREDATGYWQRELYFVTDGQGRQLSVGDLKGNFDSQDADGGYIQGGWRFGGAARNATGFGIARFESAALPGVSLFRNRAYDSRTGRWTQEDPIGVAGGLNLYQFNGNDPVAYTDPFGLCPTCVPALVAGVAVGGIRLGANLLTGRPALENVGRDAILAGAAVLTLGAAVPAIAAAKSTAGAPAVGGGTARLIGMLEEAGPSMDARIQAVSSYLPQGQKAVMTLLEGGARMLSGGSGSRATQVILNADGSTIVKKFNKAKEIFEVVKEIKP